MNSCTSNESNLIFSNDHYALYLDSVVQGSNKAIVKSATHIVSNYKSPASTSFPGIIEFKFSINEKDNELPVGLNHQVNLAVTEALPIIVFGEKTTIGLEKETEFLPPDSKYTFRLDFSPVLNSFKEKGYYETFDGTKIAESDFKGVYIAGNAEPLSWDFVNLHNKGLKLSPSAENPNIYEIEIVLNPHNEGQELEKEWKLTRDISDKPQFESDIPVLDAIYNLSLEEAKLAIEPDSTLRTGAKWGGVWTRDISYSIYLAFAMHEPDIAKNSLLKKVKNNRIIQDTGSGGAWPVSSDRTVWAIAAWEFYKFTGDEEWLKQSFEIIKNTLNDDFEVLQSSESKLYRGESSFLDWREQTYPKWMDNKDIYLSENLGTNVIHFQAHTILAKMAKALNKDGNEYERRALALKEGIYQQLWNRKRGFFNQYYYGRFKKIPSQRFEALGEALAILMEVTSEEDAFRIMSESPVTPFGVTCIYPQIPGIPPYHNNAIWPFVQSYWNLAAAKEGNEKVLTQGLASLYRAGLLFLTNYENMVAETGDFKGTEINSHRMLWSMAGNIAMVNKVFMGINLEESGIRFQPVVPSAFRGRKKLSNFKYRNATLNIEVIGFGNLIGAITMDGQPLEKGFFSANISGEHEIQIRMANNRFEKPANFVANHVSLTNPKSSLNGREISWERIPGAKSYNVYRNGKIVFETEKTSFPISEPGFAEYAITALDKDNWESFSSEPLWYLGKEPVLEFEMESFFKPADFPFSNHSGDGFIEIDKGVNEKLDFSITVKESGYYLIYFTYSNGSGPWNTDNKCAIRTLYLNGEKSAVFVFPQRGTDEWSDWGKSNATEMYFKTGSNNLSLELKPFNENMNGAVNRAMLDKISLIKVD
jgi:hypothetical protein